MMKKIGNENYGENSFPSVLFISHGENGWCPSNVEDTENGRGEENKLR